MKTFAIIALVVVAATAGFAGGSFAGYGAMLLFMMIGYALLFAVPVATAVAALVAGIFALSARASNAKPNWNAYLKVTAAIYAIALVVAIAIGVNAINHGF
jgi:hypothetical protein